MRWQPTQCPVCCRILVHRQGAAILQCPACHNLLNMYGHQSTPGQTECPSCALLLHHPLGPPCFQCPVCATPVATPIRYYQCRRCRLFLSYSTTLQVVVCPVCYEVEPPLPSSSAHIQPFPPLNTNAPPRPPPQLPRRRFPWLHQNHIPSHMLSTPLQLHHHPILPPPPLSIPPQPPIPPPTAPSTNDDHHHQRPQTPPPQTGEPLTEAKAQPNS